MWCIVSCSSTSLSWLVFFFGVLLWGSMIHKHTGRWMWQGRALVTQSVNIFFGESLSPSEGGGGQSNSPHPPLPHPDWNVTFLTVWFFFFYSDEKCEFCVMISVELAGWLCGLAKTFNIVIFSDTINVINVKLCMMVLLTHLALPLRTTSIDFDHVSTSQECQTALTDDLRRKLHRIVKYVK